jgi:hypothetical protein
LDVIGVDFNGALKAYIELHVGPQPVDIVHNWGKDLSNACDGLIENLYKINDEEPSTEDLPNAMDYFGAYETEYENKVRDFFAQELQIPILRGYKATTDSTRDLVVEMCPLTGNDCWEDTCAWWSWHGCAMRTLASIMQASSICPEEMEGEL